MKRIKINSQFSAINGFLVVMLVLLSFTMKGQDRLDILTLSGRYGFPASYDSTYQGKGNESGFNASLVAPVVLSKKSVLYSSLNYFYWNVDNDELMPEYVSNPIQLHGFILRTGLVQDLGNDRSLQLLIAPRLMTDFHNVNSDHWQFGGIGIYEKRYSETLKVGYGALFNQEFSE